MAKKKGKKTKPGENSPSFTIPPWWPYAALVSVLLFFGLIRIRLLDFPLERDEGEYAYAGQLIRHAINPYRLCYSMKLPGTAAAYAFLTAIFGQTPVGVHLGLLVVNSATIVLIYFLAQRLFGKLAGVVACASFALLSIEPSVLGFAGHATQFVVLPAVAGVLLLLKALESERLALFFWTGVSLGTAFVMKQAGMFFVFFAVFFLVYSEWSRSLKWPQLLSRVGVLFLGAALPFGLVCLAAFGAGVFPRFWFWTFSYASQYGTIIKLSYGLQILGQTGPRVLGPAALLWMIAATGLLAVLWSPKARTNAVLVWSFLAFSFAAVCPGLYFRQHYFVLLLPAVSLLCGVAISVATTMLRKFGKKPLWAALPSLLFVVALGMAIAHDGEFYFQADPVAACRQIYGHNPFPEALEIARYIRDHSAEEDRVAVVGSEPEIYFYSNRRSATGYIYTYALMEPQPFAADMQREMESEIENASPRFLVFVDVTFSWLAGPESDKSILSWSEQYARKNYQLVGVVDLLDQGTEIHWDADARNYRPRSESRVLVFQKIG